MPRGKLVLLPAALALLALIFVVRTSLTVDPGEGGRADPPPSGPDPVDSATAGMPAQPPETPDTPPDPPETPEGSLSVTGRVLHSDGKPAPGVGIGVVRSWDGGSELYRMPRISTDPEGRFTIKEVPVRGSRLALFPNVPPGTSEVEARALPATLTPPISGEPGALVRLGDFWLEEEGGIEGIVLDEEGRPVAGARVIAGLTAVPLGKTETESGPDGRFRLEGLLPGVYYVHASCEVEGRGWVFRRIEDVRPRTSGLELRLGPGNALRIRFRRGDGSGEPRLLYTGTLEIEGSAVQRSFGGSPRLPPRDEWRLFLPTGEHHMRFRSKGYLPVDLGMVRVDSDREVVIDAVLTPE